VIHHRQTVALHLPKAPFHHLLQAVCHLHQVVVQAVAVFRRAAVLKVHHRQAVALHRAAAPHRVRQTVQAALPLSAAPLPAFQETV